MVFATGEAGVGKTSLLGKFLADLPPEILLGRGQCIEHHGVVEAYLPLLDAVGGLCRGAGAESVVPILRRVAPTWLGQFPWLIEETDRAVLERELRSVAPERMLREVAQALETITQERLLVLALEDLHWTDAATADLALRLADLWRRQKRRDEAHALLTPLLARLPAADDSPEWIAARALLAD